VGLLGVLLATNQPAAVSNLLVQTTGVSVNVPNPNDPVEKEFRLLMEHDDEAHAEVDRWIKENDEFAAKGAGLPRHEMRSRIEKRLEPIQKAYEEFLQRYPDHVRARIAYASFLGDFKGEEAAQEQYEKALTYDTNNPAIYNNLANIYGHIGPVKKAFEYYDRAIKLRPDEPVYFHNFGTTVFLFRKDAREYYQINEQQVFAKAFELYSNATRLDPTNFPLASDVAQSYYGVQPFEPEQALTAWTNALRLAQDQVEREGVYVHFARIHGMAGRFALARAHLDSVTNAMYGELKRRLSRSLDEREAAAQTNAPPSAPAKPAAESNKSAN
jgi:tetratricopeptide (TPR) repeat protein